MLASRLPATLALSLLVACSSEVVATGPVDFGLDEGAPRRDLGGTGSDVDAGPPDMGTPGTDAGAPCADAETRCDDGDSCTTDRCDPELGCVHALRDLDGDGAPDSRCTPSGHPNADCNDADPDVRPDATEDCENDLDDDCDGWTDYRDRDCVPTNDRCVDARRLAGSGFYEFSTFGLRDAHATRCGEAGSAEAVFAFELLVEQGVEASVLGVGPGAALELRGPGDPELCADDARAEEDAATCVEGPSPVLFVERLGAGTYYLLFESAGPPAVHTLEFIEFSVPPPFP